MNDQEVPVIGVSGGLDPDPRDGNVGVGLDTGVSYNPDVGRGLGTEGANVTYYVDVPSPYGGIGYYPVPGGEYGELYFGLPPGSALGPYPDY